MAYIDIDLDSPSGRSMRLDVLYEQLAFCRQHGQAEMAREIEATIQAIEEEIHNPRRWWQFWRR